MTAVFDVDGLLLNTEFIWREAYRAAAEKYKMPALGDELFYRSLGLTEEDSKKVFIELLGKRDEMDNLLQEIWALGRKWMKTRLEVRPGAIEHLSFLQMHHVRLAVATSTSRSETLEHLDRMNLTEYFSAFVCGDEVHNGKPDPEIYETALHMIGGKPDSSLVFEDSPAGVEAAYRAGIPCIMCPSVIPSAEKQKNETMAIVKSLADVIPMLM